MHEDELLDTVRQEAPLESTDSARSVTEATLRTLGERITDGEASDLARHLPADLAEPLVDASPGEAEPFSLREFVERVGDRAGVDESRVVECARAVAVALAAASADELETTREQLPTEFDAVFAPGGPTTEDEFLETVRQRAGADSVDAARDAAVSTLGTLGERLSAGEAADLALYLPEPLAAAIVESDEESAVAYSFDEFVERVAERERVDEAAASVHVRAVGSALADAASEREIDAARKQLPDPFGVVFEPPESPDGNAES